MRETRLIPVELGPCPVLDNSEGRTFKMTAFYGMGRKKKEVRQKGRGWFNKEKNRRRNQHKTNSIGG